MHNIRSARIAAIIHAMSQWWYFYINIGTLQAILYILRNYLSQNEPTYIQYDPITQPLCCASHSGHRCGRLCCHCHSILFFQEYFHSDPVQLFHKRLDNFHSCSQDDHSQNLCPILDAQMAISLQLSKRNFRSRFVTNFSNIPNVLNTNNSTIIQGFVVDLDCKNYEQIFNQKRHDIIFKNNNFWLLIDDDAEPDANGTLVDGMISVVESRNFICSGRIWVNFICRNHYIVS